MLPATRGLLLVAAASLLAAGLSGSSAVAQEDPEALIQKGLEMRKRGDDLRAHGYFKRAYDIARTPRSAAQLGLANQAIGNNLDAERYLSEALATGDPWVAKNRTVLETSRDAVRAKLGKVVVRGAPASTSVEIPGHPAATLDDAGLVWVPAGETTLRFVSPDH